MSDQDLLEAVRKELVQSMGAKDSVERWRAFDSLVQLRIAEALEKLSVEAPLPPGRG
jgi:hypothetical protein